jgi:hypothetical protein
MGPNKYQDIIDNFKPGQLAPSEGKPLESFNDQKPISATLQKQLEKLIVELCKPDIYPRRFEVRQARLQRFYYRNEQHLIWNGDQKQWNGILTKDTGNDEDEQGRYRYTLNIYKQCAQTFIASMTEFLPGVKFQPSNPKNPEDITTSETAEKLKLVIERNNNINDLFQNAAMRFWTDGRTAFYTRYVTDGQRYGWKDDEKTDPNSQEQIDAYGVLEVKVPIFARNQADCIFVQKSQELDMATARSKYPNFGEKITTGTAPGEEEYDRIARLGVIEGTQLLTQSGGSFINLVTEQMNWLRPGAFLKIEDLDIRTKLMEQFPNGCYVCFCGKQYVESRNESMDEHWTITSPDPGDGQNKPSRGLVVVEVQDMINDLIYIRMQTYKYQIPAVWYDPNMVDGDSISDQESTPGMHYPLKEDHENPPGQPIGNAFFSEPMSSISSDMDAWLTQLLGPILQNLTGLQPSIFGAADESNETASGIAQLRDASKAQLGPCWSAFQYAYASIIGQAVRCAQYRNEPINTIMTTDKKDVELNIDPKDLQGNIDCYPAQSEGLPQTLDEKSSAFDLLLQNSTNNPMIAELLQDPNNLELMKECSGLDDLVIPGADSRNKQLAEITELLNSVPIPSPQLALYTKMSETAKEQGHPPIPKPADSILYQPSLAIDKDFDDNAVEFKTGKDWINSAEGQKAVNDPEKKEGVMNVRLHLLAHKTEMDAETANNLPPAPPPNVSLSLKADADPATESAILAKHGIQSTPPPTPEPGPQPEPAKMAPIKTPSKTVVSNSLTGATETKIENLPVS